MNELSSLMGQQMTISTKRQTPGKDKTITKSKIRKNPGKNKAITNQKFKTNIKKQLKELSKEELDTMENFIGLLKEQEKEQEEEQKFIEMLEQEMELEEGLNFDELNI